MSARLRIGVPNAVLSLAALHQGHGRMWIRVLEILANRAKIIPIEEATVARRTTRRRRLDVVLTDGHRDPPVASGAPLVVQIHEAGWLDEEVRELLDPAFLERLIPQTQNALGAASRVITPSEAARRDVTEGYDFDPERVHVVPHGTDAVFREGLVGRASGAHEGVTQPYFLFASMLHPRKNLAAAAGAIGMLAGEGHPHSLVVAGGPPVDRPDDGAEALQAARLGGGRVVFVGQPDDADLAVLMAGAEAFCLPSFYEGFGLTVLESMACGTPAVVSDRGALPEVVGDAGLVVAPTSEGVADALRQLIGDDDLRDNLSRAARHRARQFTWERTADGWLSVLERAAAG